MRKFLVATILLSGSVMSYTYANPGNCCYEPPIGKGDFVTKEYVDSKVAEVNAKLDAIEKRIADLKSQISSIQTVPAGLSDKVEALESAVNELGKVCPAECNAKLVKIERDLSELKEKVEKRSSHMEKEVEKSMKK
ncbi:MAG: hypothetical protein N2Z81_06710 [Hydrogenothermaceae bacterium]|nr:hypothetical protein [Hydrogenothermaceae bacterium]